MRVAQATGQAQTVGQLEHVVREEGEVLAVLIISRARVAEVVERRQPVDAGQHRRRRCAECRIRAGHQPGQDGATGRAEAAWRIRAAQCRRRVDRRDDAAGGERAILAAELQIIDDGYVFLGIIAADQPVELAAERFAVQPHFLAEGVELAVIVAVGRTHADVEIAVIDVRCAARFVFAVSGDRGQRRAAQIPVDLCRCAIILGHVAERLATRVGDATIVRVARAREHRAQAGHYVDDAVAVGDGISAAGNRGLLARVDIHRAAALLVTMRIITDDPHLQVGRWLEQQLAAHEIALAVVIIGVVDRVVIEAVALAVDAVDAEGEFVGDDRAGQGTGDADVVVIAVRRLAIAAEVELRQLGDDADRARRGVAPRQRALRPAQDFDPVDFADVVQARSGAAAIDAVDEGRDRAFKAGIVADRADAADSRRGIRLAAGRGYLQRRRELCQLADIGRAGILQCCLAHGGNGDRHVRQALAAPRRGYDDVAGVGRLRGDFCSGHGPVRIGLNGGHFLRESGGGDRQCGDGQ